MKLLSMMAAILLTSVTSVTSSQCVGINADGSAPDASAMLDVSSIAKGFLAPRMTATQHIAINLPSAGLVSSKLMILPVFITFLGLQDTLEC